MHFGVFHSVLQSGAHLGMLQQRRGALKQDGRHPQLCQQR